MLADALTHLENGRYREAEQVCLELLATQAADAAASTLLALSLQAQQRFEEAIPLLRARPPCLAPASNPATTLATRYATPAATTRPTLRCARRCDVAANAPACC